MTIEEQLAPDFMVLWDNNERDILIEKVNSKILD